VIGVVQLRKRRETMRVPIDKIMCGIDFSDYSDFALSYGAALATELKARLYVCHIIDVTSAVIYGEGMSDILIQEKHLLSYAREHVEELMKGLDVAWEPIISVGHPADEMARAAGEKAIDLAITATHGRSGLKRMILGSVTERLMRVLPCPLLAVRGKQDDDFKPSPITPRLRRILVGCDFSPYSDLAFNYGLSLAQEFQSELHLVHVIEPPTYKNLSRQANDLVEQPGKDLRVYLKETLDNMVPVEARLWCKPVTALLAGFAHEEVRKYALVNQVDLIVMGVRGQGLVEKLLVGSTTDRVIREAHCPVLSVRPLTEEG